MLTPSEMGAADRAAIEAGTPGFTLMTAAGAAVGRAAVEMMGGAYGRRVLVLCGKGNNGGDGLTAATWLHRKGARCTIVTLEDPASYKGDAARALEELRGATPLPFNGEAVSQQLERSDLVVDGMFGTGFKGALSGPAEEAASLMDGIDAPVLAIDIPSGVNGETGAVEGSAIKADVTVTLAALKPGLILHPGARLAGEVRVAGIGIGDEQMSGKLWVAEDEDAARVLPPRPAWAHKRSVGKVLVVAGSAGMAGAAALAAEGAARAG
ncbi:MAG: NAD(P)H-hydrate epimerase, partial [Actinomycetota bacterium]